MVFVVVDSEFVIEGVFRYIFEGFEVDIISFE